MKSVHSKRVTAKTSSQDDLIVKPWLPLQSHHGLGVCSVGSSLDSRVTFVSLIPPTCARHRLTCKEEVNLVALPLHRRADV